MFDFVGKKRLLIPIFIFLLIIPFVTAYHRYYHFYDTSSGLDIIGFYENNFQFIDFILYLILIGGASKVVFQRRFGASSGAGLLTIGLSGLISGALVWWEAQRGESVIMIIGNVAGPWFLWILGILFVLALYAFLRTFYGAFRSILIVLGLAVIALIGLGVKLPEIPGVPQTSSGLRLLFFIIIIFTGIFFLFRWFGKRVGAHIATPNIPNQRMSREEREILRQQGRKISARASLLEAQERELRRRMQTGEVSSEEGLRQVQEILRREEELKKRGIVIEKREKEMEQKFERERQDSIRKMSGEEQARRLQQLKALPAPNIFTGSRLTDPGQRNAFANRVYKQYLAKNLEKYKDPKKAQREAMRQYQIFLIRFQREAKRYYP